MQGKRGAQLDPPLQDAQDETESIIFTVVADLLAKTGTQPHEVHSYLHLPWHGIPWALHAKTI